MFDNSVILLAILGYLGVMFKSTLCHILDYILLYIKATIVVDSNEPFLYKNAIKIITEMHNTTLKTNVRISSGWDDAQGKLIVNCEPDLSNYIIKNGKFSWLIIYVNKDILMDRELFRIRLIFFGLNFKKYFEKFKNELLVVSSSRRVDIIERNGITVFDARKKSFDKLFIENKDYILKKIDTWINSKEYYKKNEIPYKMGILLSGNPGTGKTSFILALSEYLNYNINVLSSDIIKQGTFLKSDPHTICVIEDIDRILDGMNIPEKSNITGGDSMHSILQLLDGLHNADDSVFILTTNHKEKIDPVLYRPGRIYLDLELNDISETLANEMVNSFNTPREILNDESFPINPAYLQNKILLTFENSVL